MLRCGTEIASGITAAMIDCSPTDLHDGETLGNILNACNLDSTDGELTSGKVALMKSEESFVGF